MAKKKAVKGKEVALTPTLVTCLSAVGELIEEKGYARGIELSERTDMSRPTVSRALSRLSELGYIEHEKYRGIRLTATGKRETEKRGGRRAVLATLLGEAGLKGERLAANVRFLDAACNDELFAALQSLSNKVRRGKK